MKDKSDLNLIHRQDLSKNRMKIIAIEPKIIKKKMHNKLNCYKILWYSIYYMRATLIYQIYINIILVLY